MKKKIFTISFIVCLFAIAIAGVTLAYFTAEDSVDNVFVMKGIKIELREEFAEDSTLIPGLDINKDVYVANTGELDAYARVHIAIPTALDAGTPSSEYERNYLHWVFSDESVKSGEWSWLPTLTDGVGYSDEETLNSYKTNIDGIEYTVYVATYRQAVKAGETTDTYALDKVFIDSCVDCEWDPEKECYFYTDNKGNEVFPEDYGKNGKVEIKVLAEAAQTETFSDAYDALNTAFGVPGSYDPWNHS